MSLSVRRLGQGKIECRPFAHLCLSPDTSAVAMDDALSQSQAHTGSFKFIVVVQPLEDPEKLFRVLRIEPNAVVFDVIDVVFCVASTADFNHGAFPPLSELNRVGQQMNQNLAKQKRITPGLREGPEVKLRRWSGTSGNDLLKDPGDQRRHVQHGGLHWPATQPREV